jgi:hypothetical protein
MLGYKLKDDGMDTGLRTERQETEKGSRVGRGGGKRMITADSDVMGRMGIYLGGGRSQQWSAKEMRIKMHQEAGDSTLRSTIKPRLRPLKLAF